MEGLDLEPYFVNLIGAFVPVVAYLLVFVIKKFLPKVPKAILPMIPPLLGLGIGVLNGFVDGAQSALIAAAWGGAATVVFEIQKQLTKAAGGSQ